MILNINALSTFADEDPDLLAILYSSRRVSLPVIVLGEYRAGIARSRHRNRYEGWLESFLADSTVLDINQETTRYYATVVKSASRLPSTISGSQRFVASAYSHWSLATAISTSSRIFSASLANLRWTKRENSQAVPQRQPSISTRP